VRRFCSFKVKRLETMKKQGTITVAVVAFAFASCQKTIDHNEPAPTPEPIAATPAPMATPPPTPIPAPITVATPPPLPIATPAPELATDGRYWLRVQKSVHTADGIVGFSPGTPLTKITAGKYVTDDDQTLKLDAIDVTNVLSEARQLISSDAAAQAAQFRNLTRAETTAPVVPAPPPEEEVAPEPEQPVRQPSVPMPGYIDGVRRSTGGLEISTGLGATHTKTADGWLWQKSNDGLRWMPIRRLDGKYRIKPSERPVK
jgi:hypothetical protein